MSVVIVEAGSAGLHHALACQDLGMEHTVVIRRETQINEFLSRFRGRYEKASNANFISLNSDSRDVNFNIGILATPPTTHPELLIFLMNLQPKVIYVEKPLAMPPDTAACALDSGVTLLGGSQYVMRPSFVELLNWTTNLIRPEGLLINSYYCEPLAGPASAHSWDPEFVDGWITNEKAGGGVLGEYSHALFWVGWVLKKSGMALPTIQLDKYSQSVNTNFHISLDHIEMSIMSMGGLSGRITQSCALDLSQKSLSITCADTGNTIFLDVGLDSDYLTRIAPNGNIYSKRLFNSTRQLDAARLILHLTEVAINPTLDSPLSLDIALWVDNVISQVRDGVLE
jgi:predicted dehydrogenase